MRRRTFDLLAIVGIFAAYAVTIRLALHTDLKGSLLGGVANTVPVVIFGALVRRIILRKLVGKSAAIQLAAHLILCAAFASLAYGLLIVLLGLFYGQGPTGFLVEPFSASATAWQTLENVTTYALIATVSHLQAQTAAASPPPADPSLARYFVRIGEELRPLDMDTVVSIRGADDYAEVQTLSGKHLVQVTLAEFSQSLDPARYVRAHRSWIVNLHRIARAEPAGGGRLLLHMENGQTIATSRAGAKLLRGRVI
jgi:LytTr DNA-binding domain